MAGDPYQEIIDGFMNAYSYFSKIVWYLFKIPYDGWIALPDNVRLVSKGVFLILVFLIAVVVWRKRNDWMKVSP